MKSTSYQNSAIVLGTEVNGLAVIRSLGRLGVRCAAIAPAARGNHANFSRYLSSALVVALDSTDEQFIDALRELAAQLGGGPQVLIPTTDRFSEFLSRNIGRLSADYLPCCPRLEICDAFLDKWKTARICEEHRIRIPATTCPASPDELAAIAQVAQYPVVVKPRYTYGGAFPGKNAVFDDSRGLTAFYQRTGLYDQCVVQQVIPSGDGDIIVVASYSGNDGRVRAMYSGRKLRQFLPDYGATCFGLSERHPDIEALSLRFLEGMRYEGFAALEFARSRPDGTTYFIELNTRTYYHNQLFADAGVDLTQVAYLDACGHDHRAVLGEPMQREGVVWLDFRRDYQSMRIKRRQGKISAGSWLRSLLTARSFANWDWRDPVPFVVAGAWRTKNVASSLLGWLFG